MSIKLKAIEIEAFRAYKEKQIFDFECSTGRLANLVVLYAPNGFGKTSFFDALEWGITGKINRISRNSNVRSIAEEEQGNILKNTESSNRYGTIKIIGEDGNILEAHTKVVGVRNRKTDYCEGDLIKITSEFKKLQQTDFCSTNLLAHDKIDAFLRFSTPKERYETLSSFWDANRDTHTYNTILAIYKESTKKEEDVLLEITKLKGELLNITFSPEKVIHLISLIKGFNSKYRLTLDESLGTDTKKNLDKCLDYRTQTISSNTKLNDKIINIYSLKSEFFQYLEKTFELTTLKEKTKEASTFLNKYEELSKKERNFKYTNEEGEKYTSLFKKYNDLISNRNTFESTEKSISELLSLNLLDSKQISELNKSNSEFEIDVFKCEMNVKKSQEQQNIYLRIHNEIDLKYDEYKRIKYKEYILNRRVFTLNKLNKLRTERIDYLTEQSNEIKSYIKLEDAILIGSKYNYPKFNDEFKTCQGFHYESQKLNKLLQAKEEQYIEFGKLNNQLNDIIKYGKAFIEQTKTTICPLCNKDYENFGNLVESVNDSFGDILSVNKIYADLNDIKELLGSNAIQLKNALSNFRHFLEEEIIFKNNEIKKERIKIDKNYNMTHTKKSILTQDINNLNEIKQYFLKIETNVDNVNINDVKKSLLAISKNYEVLIIQQNLKAEELKASLKSNQELILNKKSLIIMGSGKIDELKRDPKYIQILNLITQLGFDKNLSTLNEKMKDLQLMIENNNKDTKNLKTLIFNLSQDLGSQTRDELENNLKLLKNEIVRVDNDVISFESRYRNIFGEDKQDISFKALEDLYSQMEIQIKINDNMLNILTEILEHLDYLNKNQEWIDKNKRMGGLSEQLKLITLAKTELCNVKDISVNYITDRINNYFNLNIIRLFLK